MSVSKINDRYYRQFLVDHLDNKFTLEDLYDVVQSLNPENNKSKTMSTVIPFSSTNYQIDMKAMYQFRTEKSALLFESTYKNLIQKGKSNLEVSRKNDRVLLKFKEPMFSQDNVEVSGSRTREENIGKKEEGRFVSDIFIRTVEQMFSSGIYQEPHHEENRFQKRNIVSSKGLRQQENKIVESKSESCYTLYKRVMQSNAIGHNEKVNQLVISQIKSGMKNVVDNENGELLISRIFRDLKAQTLTMIMNNPSRGIQEKLMSSGELTPETINNNVFRRGLQKIAGLFGNNNENIELEDKKSFKYRYK